MRNMLIASFGLLALGAASLAQANPGSRLTVVQTKYDRLAAYFDAKCDADDLTPKCRRVEAGMMKLGKQIEKLNDQISIRIDAEDEAFDGERKMSVIGRQYDILQIRLGKIEERLVELEASNDPQKVAKMNALNTQARLLRTRILALSDQMDPES